MASQDAIFKYQNDPIFHRVVDTIAYAALEKGWPSRTVSDARDVALAKIRYKLNQALTDDPKTGFWETDEAEQEPKFCNCLPFVCMDGALPGPMICREYASATSETNAQIAGGASQPSRATDAERLCRCTMAQKMVGDGCAICNPERAADFADVEKLIPDE